jgi:hypothetical protein
LHVAARRESVGEAQIVVEGDEFVGLAAALTKSSVAGGYTPTPTEGNSPTRSSPKRTLLLKNGMVLVFRPNFAIEVAAWIPRLLA